MLFMDTIYIPEELREFLEPFLGGLEMNELEALHTHLSGDTIEDFDVYLEENGKSKLGVICQINQKEIRDYILSRDSVI